MAQNDSATIRPLHPSEVSVEALLTKFGLEAVGDTSKIFATGITHDSKDVRPGDIYIAVPGRQHHGASFARDALERGAVAIFTDVAGWEIINSTASMTQIPGALVSQPRAQMGEFAAFVYGTADFDALRFGVTGTNGKTSVVYMLVSLLDRLGLRCGLSSTAERRIGDEVIVSALTSPEATELHALLGRMREQDVTAVAIEVSAQAVVRHRLDGVMFDVVAFNNFSQDHLDEFSTMEDYFAAKSALFAPEHARRGVVVVDSEWGRRIVAESTIPVTTLATEYGATADWHLALTRETIDGSSFVLTGPDGIHIRASVPVLGKFMAENAALAMIMLMEAGVSADRITEALQPDGLIPVYIPGRLELVSGEVGPRFYVDYGHTPGAFDAMLDALGRVAPARIIMLFGADGDRDRSKREAMGRIAARGSDLLIICDYNPRNEDPAVIRQELLRGARASDSETEILEIADPAEAVREAIKRAHADDVILYAGPGHEDFREVAGERVAFAAREEVRGALREAGYPA